MATNDIIDKDDLGNGIPLEKCDYDGGAEYETPPYTNAIPDECFAGRTTLETIKIRASVIKIGNRAFRGCTNLKSVKIEGCSTIIGEEAFRGCTKLTTLAPDGITKGIDEDILKKVRSGAEYAPMIIPSCMSRIDRFAFRNTRLIVVVIGDNVNEIEEGAFQGCKELKWVEIGSDVNVIERMAFAECKKLETIKIHSEAPPKCDVNAFSGVSTENIRLFVPRGTKEAYSKADVWKDFTIREFDYPINDNWHPLDLEDME